MKPKTARHVPLSRLAPWSSHRRRRGGPEAAKAPLGWGRVRIGRSALSGALGAAPPYSLGKGAPYGVENGLNPGQAIERGALYHRASGYFIFIKAPYGYSDAQSQR